MAKKGPKKVEKGAKNGGCCGGGVEGGWGGTPKVGAWGGPVYSAKKILRNSGIVV